MLTNRAAYDDMARRGRRLAEDYDWSSIRSRLSSAVAAIGS